jgi:hypothetical protein
MVSLLKGIRGRGDFAGRVELMTAFVSATEGTDSDLLCDDQLYIYGKLVHRLELALVYVA